MFLALAGCTRQTTYEQQAADLTEAIRLDPNDASTFFNRGITHFEKYFSIGEIRQVLCGLLREKISIQNIVTIFEEIADFGDKEHDMDLIINTVRKSIVREISFPYIYDGGAKV